MAEALKNLFSPVRINKLELKNRAVMPAMGTGFGKPDGTVSERLLAYLERRAKGGAGLLITEVCAVDPSGRGFPTELGIYKDDFIPGLKKLAETLHQCGAAGAVQLHHAGRETFKAVIGADPEAPSAIPSAILNQPCQEMSIERIEKVIAAFAAAAARAKEAGFDAVEVHAAHGYLVGQFLSPFSNQRRDAYGGSDENRSRFAVEVLKAVRKEVGPDFCIIIRVSADELIKGGYDLSFMKWLTPRLVDAGADAIHVSVGVYSTPGNLSIAGFDTEPGFNLTRARAIKEAVSVPVIAVGRIHDPRLADQAIARGDADLISFGRQHLADPDFLAKAQAGAFADIRFCLACNQGCIERLSYEMKAITCTINPECGRESRLAALPKEPPQKIFVAGAGPAGLAAALSLAERGHQVSLFEREKEPGGQLRSASRPPNKQAFREWLEWIMRQLQKVSVELNLGRELSEPLLEQSRPDLVVLASGALPVVPEIPGIKGPNVADARELLLGKREPKNPAIILGAGYVGMESADFLIERGCKVTVVEMKTAAPVPRYTAHGYWLNQRLKKSGGSLLLGALVKSIEPDAVIIERSGREQRLTPAPLVVNALGAKPERVLETSLKNLGIPYLLVGDAKEPRRLLEAIHEGFFVLMPGSG